ncbi:MAG: protein kinase [Anaerolineae bacterium]|nr:protein kinase [Anaerolineae bacterium]
MTTMQNLIGQTLGSYQIIEQIGEGGMATVFKAYQPALKREVALKVLPPYVATKEGFAERFTREAQAIGNLHHPNILPVHDFGQDKGYGYIVMRYIPQAKTLADVMKQPLDSGQIIHLTRQIADALDHAHQAGIVHRDIKPSNILLDGDWVLLSDFGLAKMIETPSEITGAGVGIGTPAYMSPEQAKGEKVDHHTDIYSLGIILFEMLTGQVPHRAETPLATVMKRISEPLPSPRSLNPAIPDDVEAVLFKALATNPAQRFDRAKDLVEALQAAFTARPDTSADKTLLSPGPAEVQSKGQVTPSTGKAAQSPLKTRLPFVIEIVSLSTLSIFSLCGFGGVLMSLVPDATGQISLGALFGFLGIVLAGLSGMAMIRLWHKSKSSLVWPVLGVPLWYVGVIILGWGIPAALNPGDISAAENLGWATVFFFGPGGFLALLGAILYGYGFRRGRVAARQAAFQVEGSTEKANARAGQLHRAADYRHHIVNLLKQLKKSPLANQLTPMRAKLNQWEEHLRQLVNRLNEFESNQIIQRDLHEVPSAITQLQQRLKTETNLQIRAQMEETLSSYREHQRQLEALAAMIRRTELEIDETLAEIGAIYSRLQLLDAKDIDSKRAGRLSEDIQEQADRLSDLLEAMDEVYESSVGGGR